MRLYTGLICVVLLLAVATAGNCQWWDFGIMNFRTTARWMGMGGVGIAAANDGAALDFNPANLAAAQIGKPAADGAEAAPLGWEGSLTYGTEGSDETSWGGRLAVVNKDKGWGAGASWERVDNGPFADDIINLGAGVKITNMPLCVGLSGTRDRWTGMGDSSETWLNAGALYTLQTRSRPIKLGLVVSNIGESRDDPIFLNVGVALPVTPKINVAADLWDVSNQWDRTFEIGAEAEVAPGVFVRAGDGGWHQNFTLGAGLKRANWSLDAAWMNSDDRSWAITGSMDF